MQSARFSFDDFVIPHDPANVTHNNDLVVCVIVSCWLSIVYSRQI